MDTLPLSQVSCENHSAFFYQGVDLFGVRALHIEQGFPDPLMNCLRLQRVVRGIKRCQGSSSLPLPITDDLMLVIWRSLDLRLPDHCMFWAACSLDILASYVLQSSPSPTCLASHHLCTWVFRILRSIHLRPLHTCTLGLKVPRLICFGRAVLFILALVSIHCVQFMPL